MNAYAASGCGAPCTIVQLSIHSSVVGEPRPHAYRLGSLNELNPCRASPFHTCDNA